MKVLAHRVDNLDRGQMRTLVDNMRNKLGSGVVVLGSAQSEDGKVALIVGVTADLVGKVQAGKIIKPVAEKVGGSGGGRPDMAEAGGKDPSQLDAALNEAYAAVEGSAEVGTGSLFGLLPSGARESEGSLRPFTHHVRVYVASLALRSCLRQQGKNVLLCYPALFPQRCRASGNGRG